MAYPMVDWKDMLFKDFTTNYRGNMSLSGGGRVARYYVALSYSRDNGILKQVPVTFLIIILSWINIRYVRMLILI